MMTRFCGKRQSVKTFVLNYRLPQPGGVRRCALTLRVCALTLALAITVEAKTSRAAEELQKTSSLVRDIGSVRQLFIDNHLIASMRNLRRDFHAAEKHKGPLMVPEHPWEGVGTAPWPSVYLFGDVIWDEAEKIYKMWYTAATKDMTGQHFSLYATSTDGIDWRKPLDLGVVKYRGSGANNILISNSSFQNILKIDSEPDPRRRYQSFAYDRNVNAYVWRFSADGLHWGDPQVMTVLPDMLDIGNVAYDESRSMYMLAVKKEHSKTYRHPVLGKYPGVEYRRWFMTTSKDTVHWTPLVEMLSDFDEVDKALYMDGEGSVMLNTYGLSLYAYHGVFLGIQWLFRITDPGGFVDAEGGTMDGRLLFSRDWKKQWQIPTRKFVLPRGRKGEFDWGLIMGVANRPVLSPGGNEWWYYYGGWDGGHGITRRRGCIGLAKLRVDGFASIDSVGTEGTLSTTRLEFTGNRLKLNADASGEDTAGARNFVKVALLDEDGRVLDGYSKESCDPFHGDSVNHTVSWQGSPDISKLAGRVIRMEIHMKGAELYALQFVDS